jgi:Acetyltransferase (GNAT) family.
MGPLPGIRIRKMRREDIRHAVRLHGDHIGHSVFSRLGPGFLAAIYEGMLSSRHGICLVCETGPEVTGFMAAATDTRALMRDVMIRRAWRLLFLAMRSPGPYVRLMKQLRTTFSYFGKTRTREPSAELLFVALDRQYRGRGIAAGLMQSALVEIKARSISSVKVSVAQDNTAAVRHLLLRGFVHRSSFGFYGIERMLYVKTDI